MADQRKCFEIAACDLLTKFSHRGGGRLPINVGEPASFDLVFMTLVLQYLQATARSSFLNGEFFFKAIE